LASQFDLLFFLSGLLFHFAPTSCSKFDICNQSQSPAASDCNHTVFKPSQQLSLNHTSAFKVQQLSLNIVKAKFELYVLSTISGCQEKMI
jgi:hypothetical protein